MREYAKEAVLKSVAGAKVFFGMPDLENLQVFDTFSNGSGENGEGT